MNIVYDEEVDVLTITLNSNPVADSDEVQPGVIFDYDNSGKAIGIEVLDASRHFQEPAFFAHGASRVNINERNTRKPVSATLSVV